MATVKELIERLQAMPSDAIVYYDNQEWGPEIIGTVELEEDHPFYPGGGMGQQHILSAVWISEGRAAKP